MNNTTIIMHPALRYSYKIIDRAAPLKILSEKIQHVAATSSSSSSTPQKTSNSSSSSSSVEEITPFNNNLLNIACDIEALVHPLQANQPRCLGDISLIQLCCPQVDNENVTIVDVLSIGKDTVKEALGPILESPEIRKVMFDCRRDVEALASQLKLRPHRVLDLQLVHTAQQWKLKASDRRSGLQFVLKQELGLDRTAGDAAVSKAMMHGNRPVWDVRPLPDHFLEYAADDVRHLYALYDTMRARHHAIMSPAERISEAYAHFYSHQMKPVEEEADVKSQTVRQDWLERYFGPAGVCGFCGARGHHEEQCFKRHQAVKSTNINSSASSSAEGKNTTLKQENTSSSSIDSSASSSSETQINNNSHNNNNNINTSQPFETATKTILRCGYCGALGHLSTNCYKKHPQLLKCGHCGQMGHTESHCFVKNPCEFCGGKHKTDKCLKKQMAEREAQRPTPTTADQQQQQE